ncbi:hypothetical protein RNZ50_19005 [Paracoccaceae bacterium Fryx2]|nr:hypothetical protein [Paracoccaceae bacterium Fryx2]
MNRRKGAGVLRVGAGERGRASMRAAGGGLSAAGEAAFEGGEGGGEDVVFDAFGVRRGPGRRWRRG